MLAFKIMTALLLLALIVRGSIHPQSQKLSRNRRAGQSCTGDKDCTKIKFTACENNKTCECDESAGIAMDRQTKECRSDADQVCQLAGSAELASRPKCKSGFKCEASPRVSEKTGVCVCEEGKHLNKAGTECHVKRLEPCKTNEECPAAHFQSCKGGKCDCDEAKGTTYDDIAGECRTASEKPCDAVFDAENISKNKFPKCQVGFECKETVCKEEEKSTDEEEGGNEEDNNRTASTKKSGSSTNAGVIIALVGFLVGAVVAAI